jgi:hypothetical protein
MDRIEGKSSERQITYVGFELCLRDSTARLKR